QAKRQTSTVRLAVASKPPARPESVGPYRGRMRVYDNYSERQIGWHKHQQLMDQELVRERHRQWLARQGQAGPFAVLVQLWRSVGSLAIADELFPAGEGINILGRHLDQLWKIDPQPMLSPTAPCWSLQIQEDKPVLTLL